MLVLASERRDSPSDVCLILEGTYPYVAGGVSSWVHDLVRSLPELTFALVHIGPKPGAYGAPRYEVPANVTILDERYCHDQRIVGPRRRPGPRRSFFSTLAGRRPSAPRLLSALRRLHLETVVDDPLLDDLATTDLSIEELLHGNVTFDLITEIAHVAAPQAPFLELFWHLRSMNVPVLRLLAGPLPPAKIYHSVSTGYAGLVAAVASRRAGRPMLLTEHGIYTRERDLELSRWSWAASENDEDPDPGGPSTTSSALRHLWSRFFVRLSQIAYHQATRIVTLSTVNRNRQLDDGAAQDRTLIVPNGVDVDTLTRADAKKHEPAPRSRPLVGFVGRVVPIKDVLTFIRACDLALREIALDIEVIGPADEDPAYAQRCRSLVESLGRAAQIRFVGPRKPREIYSQIDICVLTSFSEGQPLVLLEANAAGVPVIATDVGACRELVEGSEDGEDAALGPSGIITRVAAPAETAAAIVRLARDANLRRQLGEAGRARARTRYTKARMIESYRELYGAMEASS